MPQLYNGWLDFRYGEMFGLGEAVVVVGFNLWMADFVGGSDDVFDVVGEFVNLSISWFDGFEWCHFRCIKMVEGLPEGFAEEEEWHFRHLTFLHEDEDFTEFVHGAEAAWEEDVDFGAHGEHDFTGEEVFELEHVG